MSNKTVLMELCLALFNHNDFALRSPVLTIALLVFELPILKEFISVANI